MGAFYLVRRAPGAPASPAEGRLRESFARQGFGTPEILATPHAAIGVYRKTHAPVDNVLRSDDGSFAAAVGTMLYKELTGRAALRALLDDFTGGGISYRELFGSYCALLFDGQRVRLFTDPIGTYHVWGSDDETVISSSFLALAESAPKLTIDSQAVYEYVFNGATYGGATVFEEIRLLDAGRQWDVAATLTELPNNTGEEASAASADLADHLERNLANLRSYYRAISACFGDRVDTALSGGYDSRLTLALLLEQGRKPKIHVYGEDDDDDVVVAKRIASGERFPLKHENKRGSERPPPDGFPAIVEQNYYAFDGYPNDGLFENGTDLLTRAERCRGGELMLNGGGGEIFRNFFYLPDRALSLQQFLWSFYNRFDPKTCTVRFSEAAYYRALGAKVAAAAGADPAHKLGRDRVERIYPFFRCRFWMGRNNTVNNRIGSALTPFIDINVVPAALALPLRYKSFGLFEGRMIRAVNPRLAAYPSAYGHGFDVDPPLRRRLKELAVYARPPLLRRFTYRLKMRRPMARPYWLSDDYVARTVDTGFPYMQAFFNTGRLYDNQQYNRVCTLEYMFRRLGPAMAGSQ